MVFCEYIEADCHDHDRERIVVMMNDTNHAITANSTILQNEFHPHELAASL